MRRAKSITRDMTKGSITKTILMFVAPIFLGQLLQMTYNIADSIVVGRFVGEASLAGVAATYTPITLFNALVLGFSTGASIIIAQYFGAGEEGKLRRTFSTVYICVTVGGILMTAVVFFLARPLLKYVLNTPEENGVLDMAVLYLRIYYAGAVFVFLYHMIVGALRSLGDSVRPLWFLLISCLINICLDLVFVLVFGWGIVGVALGSALGQALACIILIVYIWRKYPIMRYKVKEFIFDREIFRLSMRLGIPEALNSCIMSICFMWQQRLVNGFGPQAMAAFLAGQRVDQIVGMPLIITGTGLAPFAGQNIGAGKLERVYEGRRKMIILSIAFTLVVTPIICIFGKNILSLFVVDPDSNVIKFAYDYLLRIAPFFLFLGITCVTNGVMRGAGDTRFATISSFVGLAARIGAAYILAFGFKMGLNGVWLSTGVGFTVNLIPTLWRWHSKRWQTKAVAGPRTQEVMDT